MPWERAQWRRGLMAAGARPGPALALSLFPVLFALLAVAATASPGPAKPRVFLSSWAVRVAAGLRDARALARRHGLLYLGQVRPGRGEAGPAHLGARTRPVSPMSVPFACPVGRDISHSARLLQAPCGLKHSQESGNSVQ